MRKISEQAAKAFYEGRPFKKDNTEVYITQEGTVAMKLFGNVIAWTRKERRTGITQALCFSFCGWNTVTTRDRLNALGVRVRTERGNIRWMFNRDRQEVIINDTATYWYDYNQAIENFYEIHEYDRMNQRYPNYSWPNYDLRKVDI